ncbi:MAG: hypothetical protein PUB21_00735 [Bacteroidales bacterium]|nr:hypothetical protein [Bacteroidales bacterium]
MIKNLYYFCFKSQNGKEYRVDIGQRTDENIPADQNIAKEIEAGPNPVVIEWGDTERLDTILSSSATLQLISRENMEFYDLFHTGIKDFPVWIRSIERNKDNPDVITSSDTVWYGHLDSELYEEPFNSASGYQVSVTASDFGVLDRIMWSGKEEFTSIWQLIRGIVREASLEQLRYEVNCSTKSNTITNNSELNVLEKIYVTGSNFHSDKTMKEMLVELLKPFSLKIMQRDGVIYIYDYDAIYGNKRPGLTSSYAGPGTTENDIPKDNFKEDVSSLGFASNESTLSTDKLYNKVKVTFDPVMEDLTLLDAEVSENSLSGLIEKKVIKLDVASDKTGFTLYRYESGDAFVSGSQEYYRIDPYLSGNERCGVYYPDLRPVTDFSTLNGVLLSVNRHPYIESGLRNKLRIRLEMCLDVRYNPFEDASINNDEGHWHTFNGKNNITYFPVNIYTTDETGKVKDIYQNKNVYGMSSFAPDDGSWNGNKLNAGEAFFAWYDVNDIKDSTGCGGFKYNSPMTGRYEDGKHITDRMIRNANKGDLIPLPPSGGFLHVEVCGPFQMWELDGKGKHWSPFTEFNLIGWLMFGDLIVDVVDENGKEIETYKYEHSAWMDKNVKEECALDTLFGSNTKRYTPAKGTLYYDLSSKNYQVLDTFSRGYHTDVPLEKLLLAEVCANYGVRANKIECTLKRVPEGLGYYTVHNPFTQLDGAGAPERKFTELRRLWNLATGASEVTLCEFRNSDYTFENE